MSKVQIFVTHEENSKSEYKCEGRCITNIVADHKSRGGLTAQYQAWKDEDFDYYGFCLHDKLFSFSRSRLSENDLGIAEYPYMDARTINDICFDDENIESVVPKYDFIIAKDIVVPLLKAESVRDHYGKTTGLFAKDYDMMLDIIKEKYSFLYPFATKYSEGKVFYPYNMFVMKKDLFREYCEMLFAVLNEFEKRTDMSKYSVRSHETAGQLAERFLGIFYLYCKEKKGIKTHEMQVASFDNTDRAAGPLEYEKGTIPIVLAADDYYVPILSTTLESIVENANEFNNYNIIVLHRNIEEKNQQILKDTYEHENITIAFVDISRNVAEYTLNARNHITTETFYRFLILDILKDYDKALYIDCDLVVCDDLAKLYAVDLGDNLIGAVRDADFTGQLNSPDMDTDKYARDVLKLDNPYDYFQAGVLLINIQEFRKKTNVQELLEWASQDLYRYSDQDMLNVMCQGRVMYLDMKWNLLFDNAKVRVEKVVAWAPLSAYEEYMNARKNPAIIHYAGDFKPWDYPDSDFAEVFWKYARKTPFYEVILKRMMENAAGKGQKKNSRINVENEYISEKVFSEGRKHIEETDSSERNAEGDDDKNSDVKKSKESFTSKLSYVLLPKDSNFRKSARRWYYKHFGAPEYDQWGHRVRK